MCSRSAALEKLPQSEAAKKVSSNLLYIPIPAELYPNYEYQIAAFSIFEISL